jgi:DNA-binding response OmpR family regulator
MELSRKVGAVRPTVLIVDDDSALAQTIRDILELDEIDAVTTSDTTSISELAGSLSPSVILIDLMLAATSGVELAAELRSGPLADIPRIAMSSSPFIREIADETDLFAAVVPKPLAYDELVDLILVHARGGESDTETA